MESVIHLFLTLRFQYFLYHTHPLSTAIGRNTVCKHQIEYGDEQADAGRDCRTRLARPKSQARAGTFVFSVQLTTSRIGNLAKPISMRCHIYRLFMRCEQTHHKRTAQKCSSAKVKHMSLSDCLRCQLGDSRLTFLLIEFAISPQRYNRLLLIQEHSLPYPSTQWLKRKTPKALSVVPAWWRVRTKLMFRPERSNPRQ